MQRSSGTSIYLCISSLESQPGGAAEFCEWSSVFICFSSESSEPVLLPVRRQSTVAQRGQPTLRDSRAASQPPVREWTARDPSACKHFFSPSKSYIWSGSLMDPVLFSNDVILNLYNPLAWKCHHHALLPCRENIPRKIFAPIFAANMKM